MEFKSLNLNQFGLVITLNWSALRGNNECEKHETAEALSLIQGPETILINSNTIILLLPSGSGPESFRRN